MDGRDLHAAHWLATRLRGELTDGEVIATSALAGFAGSLLAAGLMAVLLRWVTPRVVG